MERYNFVIGEKEFSAIKVNAFSAARHLVKLKTLLDKGLAQGTEANAIALLSGVDEKTLETVIMPILRDALVTCTTDNVKLDNEQNVNRVFTADTLFDFFDVIWEVLKLNFAPFFTRVLNLFGLNPGDLTDRVNMLAAKDQMGN
ncbi:hypothetical protein PMPD1_1735 [Paramixta manurensis]|uniref:Uncharacterized protein n=1 Tax=Paramixta manurensis TaxID=2740817 RepID=A0A6M8U7S7_9GAMM|nr:hypothetical protein PMPD1_1735 [Erwiniaceae bacterium PD-1]